MAVPESICDSLRSLIVHLGEASPFEHPRDLLDQVVARMEVEQVTGERAITEQERRAVESLVSLYVGQVETARSVAVELERMFCAGA